MHIRTTGDWWTKYSLTTLRPSQRMLRNVALNWIFFAFIIVRHPQWWMRTQTWETGETVHSKSRWMVTSLGWWKRTLGDSLCIFRWTSEISDTLVTLYHKGSCSISNSGALAYTPSWQVFLRIRTTVLADKNKHLATICFQLHWANLTKRWVSWRWAVGMDNITSFHVQVLKHQTCNNCQKPQAIV